MINACTDDYDLRTALRKWWINSHGGLRLTSIGNKVLCDLEYKSYQFNAIGISKLKTLLVLDRKMSCPYFISNMNQKSQHIDLFGCKEATIINLYGDFNAYLKSLLVG